MHVLTSLRRSLAILGAAFLLASTAIAESNIELPRLSPGASVKENIGIDSISVSIDYHRPGVKGRTIWGELVPYGENWRAGANQATLFKLSHDAKVGGQPLTAGGYAFFVLPSKDKWTLIFNKKSDQWGAYFTDAKEDALKLEVIPAASPMTEWLTYSIEPAGDDTVTVSLSWEKLKVSFPVTIDVRAAVEKQIADELAAQPEDDETLRVAAKYFFERGEKTDQCLVWVRKSRKIKDSFWGAELEGKILQAQGKTTDGISLLEKAIVMAEGKAPKAWQDGVRKTIAEWKKAKGK